jgi:GNAT superfamily N-acetyltransferase
MTRLSSSLSSKAYEAIMDWERSTGAMHVGGPFFARFFSEKEMVLFEIKNSSEGIRLSLIKTPPDLRGKGLASRALKELLSFADKHQVPVTGTVDPQQDEGDNGPILDVPQLSKWYGRNGFKVKRTGDMHRSPAAARVVEALLEVEEIDPKAFSSRLFTLDVDDLKREIETSVPGVVAPVIHFLNAMNHGEGQRQDIYVYLAKEPVSANGHDPRNSVTVQEQRQADEVIKAWLSAHGCPVLEMRMISTTTTYKSVSRCHLNRYTFDTDKGVVITGHQNDEPSKTVK